MSASAPSDTNEPRGRLAAEERLIVAAADLLGEVGPRAMSVRMVAERAGVNHGLVHHYFGGKDGLMRAAMVRLVEEHARFAMVQSQGHPIPAPLALAGDQRYLRAVVRAVLDDEMDLAKTELATGTSVPRGALEHVRSKQGSPDDEMELKAMVTLGMALEMGWAALEPFLFAVADVRADEADGVRDAVKRLRRELTSRVVA